MDRKNLSSFLLISFCCLTPKLAYSQLANFTVLDTPQPEVSATTGTTIYTEAFVDSRWVVRYRASDGRPHFANERWDDSNAFEIQIKRSPESPPERLDRGWRWIGGKEIATNDTARKHFSVELRHEEAQIGLFVHTVLDGTPVIQRWLEIRNDNKTPIAITGISVWSGRLWPRQQDFTLGYFTRDTAGSQGWLEWEVLGPDLKQLLGGTGGGHDDPFFIVRNEDKGEYCIAHLAWSGDFEMTFNPYEAQENPGEGLSFSIGPWSPEALRVVEPGETVRTPAVHLGHIEGEFDSAVHAMHDHLRKSLLPTIDRERRQRMQFCLPGDTAYHGIPVYEDAERPGFDEESILTAVDLAGAIGCETFVLDAWWWEFSGNWVPAHDRFPQGLAPIVERAKKRGMTFGLYAEIEGGRGRWEESPVIKAHPDWLWKPNTLALIQPDVYDHVDRDLDRLIRENQLALYRHDYNNDSSISVQIPRHGFQESVAWRYYDALYKLFEDARTKHPNVMLQQASAGCQRLDLGMVGRCHEAFLAEAGQPLTFRAYSGITCALPPEILVLGIGNGFDRGHLDTHLRAVYSLGTPFIISGVAPDLEQLTSTSKQRYLHHAEIYKNFIRPLLPTCKVYHHAPVTATAGVSSGAWFAMEYVAPDQTRGWATVARIAQSDDTAFLLKPRGLALGHTYRVTFDSLAETITMRGLELARDGLPIRLESPLSSELILFEQE